MSDLLRVAKGLAFQPQSTSPLVEEGDIYYDSITKQFYYFNGTTTLPVGGTTLSNITPQPVGPVGGAGVAVDASRSDHVHEGVHAVNAIKGDVNILPGTGISILTVGQNITINSTGGGGAEFDAGSITTAQSTINWANGTVQIATVRSNTNISMINATTPGQLYILKLFYDISGGYNITFNPSNVLWKNNIYPGNNGAPYINDIYYFYLGSDGFFYGFDEQNYLALQYYGAANVSIGYQPNTGNFNGIANFVTYDGNIWFPWGWNNAGQLGTGSTVDLQAPHVSFPVIGGKSFSAISVANQTVIALETGTGNAYTWGSGTDGSSGTTNTGLRSSPTSVFGGKSFAQALGGATGGNTGVIALEGSTGLAWAWGTAGNGQLGNNQTQNVSSPTSVFGGRSFKWVSSGSDFRGAIEGSTGNAYCWGSGNFGALGNSSQNNQSSPVSVFGAKSFSKIFQGSSTGTAVTVAIEGSTGNAWSWGSGSNGLLGNNTNNTQVSSPVSVVGGRSWSTVAFTNSPFINGGAWALEASTGNLFAWGAIDNGDASVNFVTRSSPAIISSKSFSKLSGGNSVVAVEGSTGIVHLFGMANPMAGVDRFPNNAIFNSLASVPVLIKPAVYNRTFSAWGGVDQRTVAIQTTTGNAYAWGGGGTLGNNSVAAASAPQSVFGGRSYVRIANTNTGLTASGTIGLIEGSTGNVYTWGGSALGNNSTTAASSPVSVFGARSFREIAGTGSGTGLCAIQGNTGNAYAWGSNTNGMLGNNSAVSASSPVSVFGAKSFKRIAAALIGFAALEGSTGTAWAWGQNNSGQLGDNSTTNRSSPVSVLGGRSFVELAGQNTPLGSSGESYCAIEGSTGNAYCWGSNSSGYLGSGTSTSSSSPVSVLGGRSFTKISASAGGPYLAIEGSTGYVWGWGGTNIGDGDTTNNRSSPVLIAGNRSYTGVFSSGFVRFAVDGAGNMYYWGQNSTSQLGNSASGFAFNSPISIGRIART